MPQDRSESVVFTLNGALHKVGKDVGAKTSLNMYIREHAQLKGTKYMCKEGGCGVCVVNVTSLHPITKLETTYSVNSCLMPVLSCHGMEITTIEGIGNKKDGYHQVIQRLALFNGTQCGFCSPAQVMTMFSALKKQSPSLTMSEIERALDGSICRCTGYRPILDAFKSFASDAHPDLINKFQDIEDLKVCKKGGIPCQGCCSIYGCPKEGINGNCESNLLTLANVSGQVEMDCDDGHVWWRAKDLTQLLDIFNLIGDRTYQLVAGNTSTGVYKDRQLAEVLIDIRNIADLRRRQISDESILVGGNVTIEEFIQVCNEANEMCSKSYGYCKPLAEHMKMVANTSIRNVATLAGNLSLKHYDKSFKSDIFVTLTALNAKLIINGKSMDETTIDLFEYLETNMNKKFIKAILLPALDESYLFKSYKIMPRAVNAYSLINAAFLFKMDPHNNSTILEPPNILFSGINKFLVQAERTREFLVGKSLKDVDTLKSALSIIASECSEGSDGSSLTTSPLFRKNLALSVFYQFALLINEDKLSEKMKSVVSFSPIDEISKGSQDYDFEDVKTPLYKPVSKKEALIQASGEAVFTNDIPPLHGELFGALVSTSISNSKIKSIDTTFALNMPGVVAFFGAEDIPGENTYLMESAFFASNEELFCSGDVLFAGQPVGVIVAKSESQALEAAKNVKIEYYSIKKPLLSVDDVLSAGDSSRIVLRDEKVSPNQTDCDEVDCTVKGEWRMGAQYHYTMETHCCVCAPTSDGIEVHSATQWIQNTQEAIAKVLNINESSIHMEVSRLGGGFGSKITKSSMIACACALAAYKLNKPVRIVLDMETNIAVIGKRCPVLSTYKVDVKKDGKILGLNAEIYIDKGCSFNDPVWMLIKEAIEQCYDSTNWNIKIYDVLTDVCSSCWARAPGTLECYSTIENIIEHIADSLGLDSLDVRKANFKDLELIEMVNSFEQSTDYSSRLSDIKLFNQANRWLKRGISLVPMVFPLWLFGNYHSMVSIYSMDGSVVITHGGIEMGQGINTKVAQICASVFGIDIHTIKVRPSSSVTSPNNNLSGASITTDGAAYSTLKCCEELLKRLEPIRNSMENPKWVDIIKEAQNQGVNLNASHMWSSAKDQSLRNYLIHGVTVLETEINVLTGQHKVSRVDILEDAGQSLNPELDIGQIEGAFVMGLGYLTCEQVDYNQETGYIATNRSWNYFVPTALDVPKDMRISLRKNSGNPLGVMRSKATGEPPLCMAVSFVFAARQAIKSARNDAGLPKEWFQLDAPCTVETIFTACGTNENDYILSLTE